MLKPYIAFLSAPDKKNWSFHFIFVLPDNVQHYCFPQQFILDLQEFLNAGIGYEWMREIPQLPLIRITYEGAMIGNFAYIKTIPSTGGFLLLLYRILILFYREGVVLSSFLFNGARPNHFLN